MSRILIIDDDDSIRESLDMYLTEEGYDVEVADRGWVGISKEDIIDAAIKKGVLKYIKKPTNTNLLDEAILEALKQ